MVNGYYLYLIFNLSYSVLSNNVRITSRQIISWKLSDYDKNISHYNRTNIKESLFVVCSSLASCLTYELYF